MTRSAWICASLALAASLAGAGCGATARNAAPSPAQVRAAFAGSPAPLRALHAQGGALLTTDPSAFHTRLAGLHGFAVVINKWASWCGPCRLEFPSFQRAAVAFGRQVAFMGLDTFDNADNARTFLREFPVTYPSFADPDTKVANALHAGAFFPTTLFFDASGKLSYMHQGPYLTATALETDIRHYALHLA